MRGRAAEIGDRGRPLTKFVQNRLVAEFDRGDLCIHFILVTCLAPGEYLRDASMADNPVTQRNILKSGSYRIQRRMKLILMNTTYFTKRSKCPYKCMRCIRCVNSRTPNRGNVTCGVLLLFRSASIRCFACDEDIFYSRRLKDILEEIFILGDLKLTN